MTDTITILQGVPGKVATKTWKADGTVGDYDAGWMFHRHEVPVSNLRELSELLTRLQAAPGYFAIRGKWISDELGGSVTRVDQRTSETTAAHVGNGWYRRWKELYEDAPHHWMCVDIDNYTPPGGIDPVVDPVTAIYRFIEEHLPAEFDNAAFHWQLSASAGHPSKKGLLKAHVWFWLTVPVLGNELEIWAPAAVDRTLYRVVQVHYTANPILEPGVVDPVPVRSGYVEGETVPLVITPAQRAAAATMKTGRQMIDPRTKSGIVGAFCRAYSIEAIMAGPLVDQFSYQQGSDRRLDWAHGGGAKGGAYLTDDRLHLCNEHNTSPVGNKPLNAFDAVRVYHFGGLDRAPGVEPFALLDMRTTPSYQAMCDWAMQLAPVIEEMRGAGGAGGAGGAVARAPQAVAIVEPTLLFPQQQIDYFANCVYVANIHRILTADGQMYDQQRFNAIYGGRSFVMDNTNTRTVRSAWECFLESQSVTFPKVVARMFRPELPPYSILEVEGTSYVNIYVPIETRAVKGDVTPFLELMAKLLPDERDRRILLTYMASLLRNLGAKFQWWPVIQGCEGNGKSALLHIMSHCVGHRYTQELNVADLAKNGIKFNSWIVGTLLLLLEEIFVENRRHFLEEFKTTVTNRRIGVEQKGVDKTTEDNRANGIMCTNHEDGVPITADSRRYAIFYTAQQTAADKLRDGMGGTYFPNLYNWLDGSGQWEGMGPGYGCAVVNWYLRNEFVIDPEFDPAGACQVAPKTSSTTKAIHRSLGVVEQEILEAIEQGEVGFRGGWISSKAVDRLLEQHRRHVPRNNRRKILQSLGYDWHPGLPDGRTNSVSIVDAGKPTLFVLKNSDIAALRGGEIITRAYISAQQ